MIAVFFLSLGVFGFSVLSFSQTSQKGNAVNIFTKIGKTTKGGDIRIPFNNNIRGFIRFAGVGYETSEYILRHKISMPLLMQDLDSYKYSPGLAQSYKISKDQKTMTFKLHQDAAWSNGDPITAEDVIFSFNLIMNKTIDAGNLRVYFTGMTAKVLDRHRIQFHVDKPKFNTFYMLATDLTPISKKQYFGKDLNRERSNPNIHSSGPYVIKEYRPDVHLILSRNKKWWGNRYKYFKNIFNLDTYYFPILGDRNLQYEKFIKGEIDAIFDLSSDIWALRVHGNDQKFFAPSLEKARSQNKQFVQTTTQDISPKPWDYISWNLRDPLFKEASTRRALAHLIPYEEIIEKAYYGAAVRATSPFGSQSENSEPELRTPQAMINFHPKEAIRLLSQDGWQDRDRDGLLERIVDGKKQDFRFTLKFNHGNIRRKTIAFLVKKSLKRFGIEVVLKETEWTALVKDMEHGQYQAYLLGWAGGSSVFPDAKQIWHSSSYGNGGSNYGGYANTKVDQLITAANLEFNLEKRKKIMRAINVLIYQDQPYAFLAERKFFNLFSTQVKSALGRYSLKYSPLIDMFLQTTKPRPHKS